MDFIYGCKKICVGGKRVGRVGKVGTYCSMSPSSRTLGLEFELDMFTKGVRSLDMFRDMSREVKHIEYY